MYPPEPDTPCPGPGRFFQVALGGAWEADELRHVASCPRCQDAEKTIWSAMDGAPLDVSILGASARSGSGEGESRDGSGPPRGWATLTRDDMVPRSDSELRSKFIRDRKATDTDAPSSLPPLDTVTAWTSGTVEAQRDLPPRLGDFEVIREIGRGGMGTVYEVRDVALNRLAALKINRRFRAAEGETLDRFFREARVTANLEHPSIVPIYHVGQFDGMPYVVSKLIDGDNLSALMKRFDRPPHHVAARLVAEIADALQYMHERGIIHRDVKPSNILIDANGRAVLTDFGLARDFCSPDEATITIEGQIFGTPAYMSPEQAEGQIGEVGVASDIYSLGATLYACLTGRPPHQGSPSETLRRIFEIEPTPPRVLDPTIPRDLEAICLTAMRKSRAERYASARAMAADLKRFVDGAPIHARPFGKAHRLDRWLRRRARPVALCFGVLVWTLMTLAFAVSERSHAIREARRRVEAESRLRIATEAGADLRRAVNQASEVELRRSVAAAEAAFRSNLASRSAHLKEKRFGPDGDAPAGNDRAARALTSAVHRLGDLLVNTDRLAEAAKTYETAVTLLGSALQVDEAGDLASRMADVLTNLGETRWALGQRAAARAAFFQAIQIHQELVRSHPADPDHRFRLFRARDRLDALSKAAGVPLEIPGR